MPYFTVHIYYPVLEFYTYKQTDSVDCNYYILTCYFLNYILLYFCVKILTHINISGNLQTINHLNL